MSRCRIVTNTPAAMALTQTPAPATSRSSGASATSNQTANATASKPATVGTRALTPQTCACVAVIAAVEDSQCSPSCPQDLSTLGKNHKLVVHLRAHLHAAS